MAANLYHVQVIPKTIGTNKGGGVKLNKLSVAVCIHIISVENEKVIQNANC